MIRAVMREPTRTQECSLTRECAGSHRYPSRYAAPMKTFFRLPNFLPARLGATALWLSSAALACHTEDAMKKTGDALATAGGPEAKRDAKSAPPADASRPAASKERAQYGVEYIPGGIDRVILTKRDDARNLCIQVTLASPGIADVEAPAGKVDLPPTWTVERAIIVRDATACGAPLRRWPDGAVNATEITGSVRWGSSPTEKTAVDLRLSFPARGAEPAFAERLAFTR
jgi:hypothetical protein